MRFSFIATLLRRLFYLVQTGTKSFIYNRFERHVQFSRDRPRPIHHIIIY